MKRRIELRLSLARDLHPVLGDRIQLQQVLLNLIVNACDAMAQTPVRQRVMTILSSNVSEGQVRVSVADRGDGISKDIEGRIFEPFVSTKPGMNGLDIQRRLTREGVLLPTVVITAHDEPGSRLRCVNAGATAYLTKPLSAETLIDAIHQAVNSVTFH